MKRLFKIAVVTLGITSLLLGTSSCRRKNAGSAVAEPVLSDPNIPNVDLPPSDTTFDTGVDTSLASRTDVPYAAVPGLEPVYFDYDRSELRGSEQVKVDNAAAYFRSNSGLFVLVEGHTDERGSNEYNLGLGERRAMAIRDALIQRGIEAGRIQTLSKGEEFPAVMGRDESAWSRNRRGEFLAGQ